MTTTTDTLADFLLRRIEADEAAARAAGERQRVTWGTTADTAAAVAGPDAGLFILFNDPARVLAECAAKRRVVTLMGYVLESWEGKHGREGRVMWPDVNRRERSHARTILEVLALPYAGHPEMRAEWLP